MIGDRLNGTNNVERLYKYVAETAEERKLKHVFVLGDITEIGYWNDYNMVNAAKGWPRITEEWELAQKAIFQLNGKVKYNLCRGNHDDYMMDDYFNVPEYTDQFKNEGGFFSDTGAKYPGGGRNQSLNPTGAVYWSAKTGAHDETITNSWRTMEICGTKYLFITVDYNPSKAVADWVDETLAKYPDHKAIITTHSYMKANGDLIISESGEVYYPSAYGGQNMWKKVYSKHANVFMIACGHVGGADVPVYKISTGDNGNKVYQFVINPQFMDLKEPRKDGESPVGKQDTGLVMYMNFSEDGKTISMNYYSTLLNKFRKDANFTISVGDEIDEVGSIDMADLADYGQNTPLITEQKTPKCNGIVEDGEYSATKVTKKEDIGRGKINSDLTEYYAYDNDYLYYAFSAKSLSTSTCTLNLHLESSLYTLSEINSDLHSKKISISLDHLKCGLVSNDGYSLPMNNSDIACYVGTDSKTGYPVYEIKISREYLRNNAAPDNLLSYSLNIGTGMHYFNIKNDAKEYLSSLGLKNVFQWTYNYAYFGTRPETTPETTVPETDATADTTAAVTEPEDKGGCKSMLTFAPVAFITAVSGAAILVSKKKRNV